jgi:hypothetical protein
MINIKEQVGKIKGGGGTISAGIHSAVDIENVERGTNFVDIHLKDEYGRTKKDRVFDPDISYVYPKDGQAKEEAFAEDVNERSKRLLQYVIAVSDSPLPDNVGGYEDVVKLTMSLLSKPSFQINLKMVPSKQDPTWSDFPKYAPYVDRYNSDKPTTLRFSNYELGLFKNVEKTKVSTESDPFTLF